jgi:hypothetical protein
MKKQFKTHSPLSFLFCFFLFSAADLLAAENNFSLRVEPSVGWQFFGGIQGSDPAYSNSSSYPDTFDGVNFALKVAVPINDWILLGFDVQSLPFLRWHKFVNNNYQLMTNQPYSYAWRYALLLGFRVNEWNNMLFWLGVNLLDNVTESLTDSADNIRSYRYLGQGFKLAVSYPIMPYFSVNLEYNYTNYIDFVKNYSSSSVMMTSENFNNLYSNSLLLSFSAPIELKIN